MLCKYRKKTGQESVNVLGTYVSALTFNEVIEKIDTWIREKSSRYICICPVYSIMLARSNSTYRDVLNSADIVTPDGKPVVLFMRLSGKPKQQHIRGTSLMLKLCERACIEGYSVFLYGVTNEKLKRLERRLCERFPGLKIAGKYAPPFRPLTQEEDEEIIRKISESGADILFVAIGAPKQEIWMAEHKDRFDCVQIGVGAAFDFLSGSVREAPKIFQALSLEWAFRLAMEPRRVYKKYLLYNHRFIFLSLFTLIERFFHPGKML